MVHDPHAPIGTADNTPREGETNGGRVILEYPRIRPGVAILDLWSLELYLAQNCIRKHETGEIVKRWLTFVKVTSEHLPSPRDGENGRIPMPVEAIRPRTEPGTVVSMAPPEFKSKVLGGGDPERPLVLLERPMKGHEEITDGDDLQVVGRYDPYREAPDERVRPLRELAEKFDPETLPFAQLGVSTQPGVSLDSLDTAVPANGTSLVRLTESDDGRLETATTDSMEQLHVRTGDPIGTYDVVATTDKSWPIGQLSGCLSPVEGDEILGRIDWTELPTLLQDLCESHPVTIERSVLVEFGTPCNIPSSRVHSRRRSLSTDTGSEPRPETTDSPSPAGESEAASATRDDRTAGLVPSFLIHEEVTPEMVEAAIQTLRTDSAGVTPVTAEGAAELAADLPEHIFRYWEAQSGAPELAAFQHLETGERIIVEDLEDDLYSDKRLGVSTQAPTIDGGLSEPANVLKSDSETAAAREVLLQMYGTGRTDSTDVAVPKLE